VPRAFGSDVSSFGPEDLAIGWRSGTAWSVGDDAIDVSVGRLPYQLGHGMLLYDGAGEGGSRGGYWTNARKAFEFGTVARFAPAHHRAEVFYLDRDELPEHDTGSRLWGVNYELTPGDETTIGVTYMKWFAHADLAPGRDGLSVWNLRAYTRPLTAVRQLSVDAEYAAERNGARLDADAWTVQGAYDLDAITWTPTVSYRYAWFQGDDPATPAHEAFDPLSPGFSDWGSWWQGEIAGEYFVANSNLVSHQVRVHVAPRESLSGGVILYGFRADVPASYGSGVTARDIAFETDLYTDWKVREHVTLSVVAAYADPGKAVQQASGRTKNFAYGMIYVAYSR